MHSAGWPGSLPSLLSRRHRPAPIIILLNREAAVGSSYKAVFVVPHGCAGSATTEIRVQIPEGVIGVKPMQRPGWKVETVKGKYPSEYDFHGA